MYIIIECHGGAEYASILQEEDGSGNQVFETEVEAMVEAEDCQDPIILEVV